MDSKTPAEICEAVALDLRTRKITHQQAGDIIGKSKAIISNQISGKKAFSKRMAELFSRAFGYNIRFLLYGEGELRGDVAMDIVQVPDTDGESWEEDVVVLAALADIAEGILRVIGDKDAISAWRSIIVGDFEQFNSCMKSLSESHHNRTYVPMSAWYVCEKIKGKKGPKGSRFIVVK